MFINTYIRLLVFELYENGYTHQQCAKLIVFDVAHCIDADRGEVFGQSILRDFVILFVAIMIVISIICKFS